MSHPDAYRSIVYTTTGDFRDRGSKFLGYLIPCSSETEVKEVSERLRLEHPGSRHVCYGAVFGPGESERLSNDDGEPRGTAGLPILNRLLGAELEMAALFVVRYFGGTKLGKSGLINAYKSCAEQTLSQAKTFTKYRTKRIKFTFAYDHTGTVMKGIERIEHANIVDHSFDQHQTVTAAIPVSQVADALHLFNHIDGITVEAMDD